MNDYKSYAIAAAYFIISNIDNKLMGKINNVILFGSIAQNRATKESDVDLFFDATLNKTQENTLKISLNKIAEEFYTSNAALQFKLRRIDNRISCIVGELKKWKDLKRSIISTGIVLYGKYSSGMGKKDLKQFFIMSWEAPKMRGAFLNKLYGYMAGKKRYSGMIENFNAEKIGKSALLVMSEHKGKFMQLMENYNANYEIIEVYR
ncbi:MAG: nucleotidyltransferase domain-containing protein [Candidatus Aenigmarchaeota archaeon]|nr:nucleotidyltransferase domain-containing protein [Candidatus Aenigmarchaeota archaeon]